MSADEVDGARDCRAVRTSIAEETTVNGPDKQPESSVGGFWYESVPFGLQQPSINAAQALSVSRRLVVRCRDGALTDASPVELVGNCDGVVGLEESKRRKVIVLVEKSGWESKPGWDGFSQEEAEGDGGEEGISFNEPREKVGAVRWLICKFLGNRVVANHTVEIGTRNEVGVKNKFGSEENLVDISPLRDIVKPLHRVLRDHVIRVKKIQILPRGGVHTGVAGGGKPAVGLADDSDAGVSSRVIVENCRRAVR